MDPKLLEELRQLDLNIDSISDLKMQRGVRVLSNAVESLVITLKKALEENQTLKNEINRLKGEQGPPNIRPQSKNDKTDHSSEDNRKKNQNSKLRKPKVTKKEIKADRRVKLTIEKSTLPADAKFKGYTSSIFQGIKILSDNIEFIREEYYSASEGKYYLAPLPPGYEGSEYTPELKAIVLGLHYDSQMTQSAILRFLTSHGMQISDATISSMLTKGLSVFHDEKQAIFTSGLRSSTFVQTDDTGGRVKGKNVYVHIFCNDWYSAYFTRKHKDRLTVLEILNNGPLKFVFNEASLDLIKADLPEKYLRQLEAFCEQYRDIFLSREQVDQWLLTIFPNQDKHQKQRQLILEASAIIAYSLRTDAIRILIADDAPQFKKLTEYLGLCWIHDGRHYKKLRPVLIEYQNKLEVFLTQYWAYYDKLLEYKKSPSEFQAAILENEFDNLMDTTTGYDLLDERIAKTKEKKNSLLLVLKFPEIPLHNNTSELGARRQARDRDISFHTMSEEGTKVKDTLMTISETAKKLGINVFHYFRDRLTKTFDMPSLATEILRRSGIAPNSG